MNQKMFILAFSLLICTTRIKAQVYDKTWWLSFPHVLDTSFFAGEDMYGYLSPFTLDVADSLFLMNDVDKSGFYFFCSNSINHIFLGTPGHAGLYQIKVTDSSAAHVHGSKRYDLLVYSLSDTSRTTPSLFLAPPPPDSIVLYTQMLDSVLIPTSDTINSFIDKDGTWFSRLETADPSVQAMDTSFIECKLDTATHKPVGLETMKAAFFFSREEPLVLLVLSDPSDSCRYKGSVSQQTTDRKASLAFDYLTEVLVPSMTRDQSLRDRFKAMLKNIYTNSQYKVTYAKGFFSDLMGQFAHTDAGALRSNTIRLAQEKKYFNQVMVLIASGFAGIRYP